MDDVVTSLNKLKPGVRYDHTSRTFTWEQDKVAQDQAKNQEQHTMDVFSEMASSLIGCLEFTWDSPSMHQTGMMPVLDTVMWMGKPTRSWELPDAILPPGTTGIPTNPLLKNNVMYKFYRKQIANQTPMNSRSAAPTKQKLQTATNEFRRRMLNTSRFLPKHHLEEALSTYSLDLARGGFTLGFIQESLLCDTKNYRRLLMQEIRGERNVNRSQDFGKLARVSKKITAKSDWFSVSGL